MPKSRKQLADEAYQRVWGGAHENDLPGQIDLLANTVTGGAPSPDAERPIVDSHPDVPTHCPGCGRTQTYEHGWTCVRDPLPLSGMLQCGACGYLASVPREAYDTLKARIVTFFAGLQPGKPTRERRVRGAG